MSTLIQVRVDDQLKFKASQIYEELGLDLSTAIRLFLKRSITENGIPFSMVLPNKNFGDDNGLQALHDINSVAEKSGSANMTLDEINAEIDSARRAMSK